MGDGTRAPRCRPPPPGRQAATSGPLVGRSSSTVRRRAARNPDVVSGTAPPRQHLPTHAQVHHAGAVSVGLWTPAVLVSTTNCRADPGSLIRAPPQPRRQIRGPGIVAAHSAGVGAAGLGIGRSREPLQAAPRHRLRALGHPVMIASAARSRAQVSPIEPVMIASAARKPSAAGHLSIQ